MDNIKKSIDNLFDDIENSKLYKDYLSVKCQLENNLEIIKIIEEIKRLQKIATNNKDENIEQKLVILYEKLNNYPVYQSYMDIKNELNNELTFVKNNFEYYFKSVLEI